MKARCLVCLALVMLAVPRAPARAQQLPLVEIASGAGVHATPGDFGPAAAAGSTWYLRLDRTQPAFAFEMSARLAWPGQALGLRFTSGSGLRPTSWA